MDSDILNKYKMKNISKIKLDSEKIESKIQRHSKDHLKKRNQMVHTETEIAVQKINEKYDLKFPYDEFSGIRIDVMNEIFCKSDKNHANSMFDIFVQIAEIDLQNIVKDQTDMKLCMHEFSNKVSEILFNSINSQLYFDLDKALASIAFQLLNEQGGTFEYHGSIVKSNLDICNIRNN
jgi:hypothetical protein